MDREDKIQNIENLKAGKPAKLYENVSLHIKNDQVFNGIEKISEAELSWYTGSVRILLIEGELTDYCKMVKEIVLPSLTIIEGRTAEDHPGIIQAEDHDTAATFMKLRGY